jgi:hypothetical protein
MLADISQFTEQQQEAANVVREILEGSDIPIDGLAQIKIQDLFNFLKLMQEMQALDLAFYKGDEMLQKYLLDIVNHMQEASQPLQQVMLLLKRLSRDELEKLFVLLKDNFDLLDVLPKLSANLLQVLLQKSDEIQKTIFDDLDDILQFMPQDVLCQILQKKDDIVNLFLWHLYNGIASYYENSLRLVLNGPLFRQLLAKDETTLTDYLNDDDCDPFNDEQLESIVFGVNENGEATIGEDDLPFPSFPKNNPIGEPGPRDASKVRDAAKDELTPAGDAFLALLLYANNNNLHDIAAHCMNSVANLVPLCPACNIAKSDN